jgi:hypothetical protein
MSAVPTELQLPSTSTEYATQAAGRKFKDELPHLRLVAPLRPERASRGLFAVVITVILALGLIVMLLLNTSVAQTAFVVSELQLEQRELARQEASLTEAIAAAAAPPVLESKARALGMVPTTRPVFLTIPSGRVRGKAKPAPGDQTRTANVAGSLTATLIDPLPIDQVAGGEESPSAERRQIGDGAVLVEPGAEAITDAATEQARRNEERQALRETATTDGAVLVDPDQPAAPEADGAQLTEAGE